MSNPSISSGNGSIYSNGYAMGQNAALKQNEMNNAIGGKGKRGKGKRGKGKRGGASSIEVQPVHASYPNSGIQRLNTDLTQVSAQQQANAKYDNNVKIGGSRRRRSIKRRTNKRKTRRVRKSRRHR